MQYLIRDNDKKFSKSFDSVFASEGVEIVRTPFQAPKANAIAERWVRSVREECLDRLLILNERHLYRVLNEYITYYNEARPHQGIEQQTPIVSNRNVTRRYSLSRCSWRDNPRLLSTSCLIFLSDRVFAPCGFFTIRGEVATTVIMMVPLLIYNPNFDGGNRCCIVPHSAHWRRVNHYDYPLR